MTDKIVCFLNIKKTALLMFTLFLNKHKHYDPGCINLFLC